MRALIVLVLALVFIVLVLLPYLFPIQLQLYLYPKKVSQNPFLVKISKNKYLVKEPPSWIAVYGLARRGLASYWYIAPCDVDDLETLYYYHVIENMSCEEIIAMFKATGRIIHYGFLLKDNCKWMKTFLFNTTPDWYLAHSFIKPLEIQKIREYEGEVDLYLLVYESDEGLMIEFYNILNETELTELKEKIRSLISKNPITILLTKRAISTWWYDLYTYLKEKNIPYIILMTSEARIEEDTDWFTPYKDLYESILEGALAGPLSFDEIISFKAVIYVDGEPVAVVVEQLCECEFFAKNIPCRDINIVDMLEEILNKTVG